MEKKDDSGASQRAVYWENDSLTLLDQRKLPGKYEVIKCATVDEVAEAIQNMTVRGAPAIGAAGGFGMAIAAAVASKGSVAEMLAALKRAKDQLDKARPTAVNLSWATTRIADLAGVVANKKKDCTAADLASIVLTEALQLAEDDVRINKTLGAHGAAVVPQGANMLHHCNTGRLATVDYGTALGIIYTAHEQGKNIHVWVDETRPRLQGARLTAWELMRAGVDMHLIVDGASGLLMSQGKVDVVVFGADRVAANGDVANKIGTHNLAVVAHTYGVPVYCAVPTPTIDLNVLTGKDIVIEERDGKEITHPQDVGAPSVAPDGVQTFNPAFDVTPFRFITGIVTEEGICYPPFSKSLKEAKERAEKRVQDEWNNKIKHYSE